MNEKEKFKQLVKDMIPVIKSMNEVLEKHGARDTASLVVSTDGYFRFRIFETEWEFTRVDSKSKPKIRMECTEEIKWED